MNHQQWLDWRRGGIGASDVGIILGVTPKTWGTPYSLWVDKVYGIGKDDNAAMAHGRETEPKARRWLEEQMGMPFEEGVRREHSAKPYLRCTLDCYNKEHGVIGEIKCPLNLTDHLDAVRALTPPNKYYAQLQMQMLVFEKDVNHYCSFREYEKPVYFKVYRDDNFIKMMEPKIDAFWQLVVNKTPPPMEEQDYLIMVDNMHWQEKLREYLLVKNQKKEIEAKEAKLKEEIISLSQGRNARCKEFEVTKTECEGRVDYKEVMRDYLGRLKACFPDTVFPNIPIEAHRTGSFTKWTIRDI